MGPVPVNVSMILMKIVSMAEVDDTIEFQFEIMLEWQENRAHSHNHKDEGPLNAHSDGDIKKVWIPHVIYDNTDQKESTRLGDNDEWRT